MSWGWLGVGRGSYKSWWVEGFSRGDGFLGVGWVAAVDKRWVGGRGAVLLTERTQNKASEYSGGRQMERWFRNTRATLRRARRKMHSGGIACIW